ncbi:CyaA/EF/ExoY family adenylyl cyclase toxin [Vibrio sp. Y29_XK_CS5]|uniref:CyaA/EF/ExoY family adenylyl cyclase toxin n=1 Tax=Vibrio sp. Y29_XK_CS5 TaxID=2957762 RepID=UPI0020A45623|nr:CyaA/EF/ExoY family adenylyl cyclase toxin [Vibrio sp. Y29_XK_CS5]
MKKEKSFKRSALSLAMLVSVSSLPSAVLASVEINYRAENIYNSDANNYGCQISLDAAVKSGYKLLDGSIVNVEILRFNKETENPYIAHEVFFGVLKEQNGRLSLTREAMIHGDQDPSATCIVTNVGFSGLVRSELKNKSSDFQSGIAIYEEQPVKAGPISSLTTLADILSVPFIMSLKEDASSELVDMLPLTVGDGDERLRNTSNVENYAVFFKEVMSGKTGVKGAFKNGLSRNFLEEKTKDRIEEFLVRSLIEPAEVHRLISSEVDKTLLATLLRKTILAELEQDSYFEYGSEQNIQATLAFQYSSAISSSMQLIEDDAQLSSALIAEWNKIEKSYDEMSEAALDIGFPLIYAKKDLEGKKVSIRTLEESGVYVSHALDTTMGDEFNVNPYEPISASIPAGWSIAISDNYSLVGQGKKIIEGPFSGNLPMFWESNFSLKPLSLVALPPPDFVPQNESLDSPINIHPSDAYMHMQLAMNYPDLDGIDLAREVFSSNNSDVSIDVEAGTINYLKSEGGFLGKNFVQIASTVYQKEIDDLEDWEILSVKASLDAVGIDTTFAYGSPNNIKSSLLHRLSLQLTENALEAFIGSGLEPALFDELESQGLTQLDAKKAFIDLVYNTFTNSNLGMRFSSSMSEDMKKQAVYDSLMSWYSANEDLKSALVAVDYDSEAGQHIFNYPLTDELYAKGRLYTYGATSEEVEELWRPYLKHGRLDLLHLHGYKVQPWLINKDKNELGALTNTVQWEWHRNHEVLSQKLGLFLGTMIDAKAKLTGKKAYTTQVASRGDARLHHGVKLYQVRQDSSALGQSTLVSRPNINQYVLTSTSLGYTVLLPNSIPGLFDTDKISFRYANLDYHDIKDESPLFVEMSPNVAKQCELEDFESMYYAYNYCKSIYTQTGSNNVGDADLMASLITKHLIDNRDQLKTVTTDSDYIKGVLQAIVPVWATVEDFEKGNDGMATLGLLSDVAFFLPIGEAVFTSAKLTGKVVSNAIPRKFKVSSRFNKVTIGSNTRVSGQVFDIDVKAAKIEARKAWLNVPKTILNEMNLIPVGDIVKGVKSASLKIKQRVKSVKINNTAPYAPKVYQSRDFRISSSDRPDFDPDAIVGIPTKDREAFASVADAENSVIGVRFVDPNNRSLLESGLYSSKSLLIKSKSSDWGPHAGFIPVNQKYAKSSAQRDVVKYNHYSDNAIQSKAALPVPLSIDDKRLKELQSGDNPLIPELIEDLDSGMLKGTSNGVDFYYQEHDGLWMIHVKDGSSIPAPLMVMGDYTSHKPMTADYDLFSVMAHISDYGVSDLVKVPLPHAKWKATIENPDKLSPDLKELYDNEDLYNKVNNMHLGAISERVNSLKDKVNNRLGRGKGMELIHHGADESNPFPDIEANFPATYFVPKRYLNHDAFGPGQGSLRDYFQVDEVGTVILKDVDDFANFHQLMTNVQFTGPLNSLWSKEYGQLARKNRLSHAYLNAREQVEALLTQGIDVAQLKVYIPGVFDEMLPPGRIPAKPIESFRVYKEIIDIVEDSSGVHSATLRNYLGGFGWVGRPARVVRVGYYYYYVTKIDNEYFLTDENGLKTLRIVKDEEGYWVADEPLPDGGNEENEGGIEPPPDLGPDEGGQIQPPPDLGPGEGGQIQPPPDLGPLMSNY